MTEIVNSDPMQFRNTLVFQVCGILIHKIHLYLQISTEWPEGETFLWEDRCLHDIDVNMATDFWKRLLFFQN